MDLNLKDRDRDYWYSLHGQVPGLLDWNMGNELSLCYTTDQSSPAEKTLFKYKMQIAKPPKMPQERNSNPDNVGCPSAPSLWMWVNPNIVCPLNNQNTKTPNNKDPSLSSPTKNEVLTCSEDQSVVESLPSSTEVQSPKQKLPISSSSMSAPVKEKDEEQESTSPSHISKNRKKTKKKKKKKKKKKEKKRRRMSCSCSPSTTGSTSTTDTRFP